MKKLIVLILILDMTALFAKEFCHTDILNGEKVKSENVTKRYLQYDFSDLWTQEKLTLGIIGDDYQRLYMKLLFVVKNENAPNEYLVYGRSKVKSNICDFVGKIIVEEIRETHREWFGVDNEDLGKSKTQGILTARYEFLENKTQKHTGVFSGVLQTKWYLDTNDKMAYDDMNSHADPYFNNSFVGTWRMYDSNVKKICNWADYRVPNVKCDFDTGAGEFHVNDKYVKNGWENYKLAFGTYPDTTDAVKARQKEKELWWK